MLLHAGAVNMIQRHFSPIPNASFVPHPLNASGFDTADKTEWSEVYLAIAQHPRTAVIAVSNNNCVTACSLSVAVMAQL